MALGKIFGGGEKRRRRKARAAATAARLAPLEEKSAAQAVKQAAAGGNNYPNGQAAVIFDAAAQHVPNDFSDEGRTMGPQIFGLDAVVAVILGIAALFIVLISFLIYLMPVSN